MTTGEPRKRGRPSRADQRNVRDEIVEAARQSFARHGYEATTIAGIAGRVRISGNTIYHYFGNKRGLWLAVYQETYEKVWGPLGQESDDLSVCDAFVAAVERARAFRHTSGEQEVGDFLYRATSDMLTNDELGIMREQLLARREQYFRDLAVRGMANGELTALGDVTTAASILRVLMLGVLHDAHVARTVSDDVISAVERSLAMFSQPGVMAV